MCQDSVLATDGSTHGEGSTFLATVSQVEAWIIARVVEVLLGEEEPVVNARLYGIFYVRHYLSSIQATLNRSDGSIFSHSSQFDIAIRICSYIELLDLRCSNEAIVNPLIYACASRYREYERHSHCPRTVTCDSSYHPCDRVSVVGEGELHLLFVSLERSGIKLEPFSIACREHSALVPIEHLSVVATKIVTVVQFPAKEDWLGGSDLHVVLGDILINHFICKFLYYTGQVSCKVKPSRNFDSSLGQNIVFAIEGNAYGDVSRISALVLECESRQQTDFVDELVRYAVPLCGASCLVVLNALLDGSCFLASIGIDSSRYHSGLYLKGHIGCDVHIAVLQTRSSKEVSIYHLLYAHASRNWTCERNSCAWAVECDLTGYECHSIRVVGEGELYRVASLKNRSNIQLVPS